MGSSIVIAILLGLGFLIWSSGIRGEPEQRVSGLRDLADPSGTYDPVRAGEETPRGFRQLLARDRIAPIYDPTFVPASAAEWPDDALVIGVEIDGEARAYPVSHLTSREMVIDRIAGIPVLVTW